MVHQHCILSSKFCKGFLLIVGCFDGWRLIKRLDYPVLIFDKRKEIVELERFHVLLHQFDHLLGDKETFIVRSPFGSVRSFRLVEIDHIDFLFICLEEIKQSFRSTDFLDARFYVNDAVLAGHPIKLHINGFIHDSCFG